MGDEKSWAGRRVLCQSKPCGHEQDCQKLLRNLLASPHRASLVLHESSQPDRINAQLLQFTSFYVNLPYGGPPKMSSFAPLCGCLWQAPLISACETQPPLALTVQDGVSMIDFGDP